MYERVLLVSEKQIKANSIIEDNVDCKILGKIIQDMQTINLRPVIGADLYNQVLEAVYNSATDSNYMFDSTMKELIDYYIQPYLIHTVVADLIISNHYKLTNKGVLKLNDSNSVSIPSNELESLRSYYDNKTITYKSLLIQYLNDKKLIGDSCKKDNSIINGIGWYM